MPRRSKEQIKKDREELRELIQNMESVQDIMKWKNHPYEADNKLFTVKAYNRDMHAWNIMKKIEQKASNDMMLA